MLTGGQYFVFNEKESKLRYESNSLQRKRIWLVTSWPFDAWENMSSDSVWQVGSSRDILSQIKGSHLRKMVWHEKMTFGAEIVLGHQCSVWPYEKKGIIQRVQENQCPDLHFALIQFKFWSCLLLLFPFDTYNFRWKTQSSSSEILVRDRWLWSTTLLHCKAKLG